MPRDVLGYNLEVLDTIRMDDEVFITLTGGGAQPPALLIQGFALEHVKAAEGHLHNLIKKVEGNFFDFEPAYICLDESKGTQVALRKPAPTDFPQVGEELIPIFQLSTTQRETNLTKAALDRFLTPEKLAQLQYQLAMSLESIRYKRASCDLTIRLGSFTLTRHGIFNQTVVPKEKFLATLTSESRLVDTAVTKW